MKKLLIYSTCHGGALDIFFRENPRYWQEFEGGRTQIDWHTKPVAPGTTPATVIYNFQVNLGHTPVEDLVYAVKEADVFLYRNLNPAVKHHKAPPSMLLPLLKPGAQAVAMTVPYERGMFVHPRKWRTELKDAVRRRVAQSGWAATVEYYLSEGDLDWALRSRACLEWTQRREKTDGVPLALCVSDIIENDLRNHRLFTSHDHPSSWLLWPWSLRISDYLGFPYTGDRSRVFPLNYAGLLNFGAVCSSAKRYLDLKFSADPPELPRTIELFQQALTD